MTADPEAASHTWLVRVLVLLAALLAANSILGPLALEIIDYRYSQSLINQGIGLDAVALFGAAPMAVVAAWLVSRHHPAGSVLAFIPATFAAYMAPQYIVGPDYLGLAGNNERFVPFHIALFITGVAAAVLAWVSVDWSRLEADNPERNRRRRLVLLGVVAFIFLGRWLAGIIDLIGGDPTSSDYRENPTAYLLIGVLDLGVVVPSALVAAAALRRRQPWARTAAYAVIGWFSLVPAAVAAMAVVMSVRDDPNASTGATVMFVIAGAVFTLGAASLYRPILRPSDRRDLRGEASLDRRRATAESSAPVPFSR